MTSARVATIAAARSGAPAPIESRGSDGECGRRGGRPDARTRTAAAEFGAGVFPGSSILSGSEIPWCSAGVGAVPALEVDGHRFEAPDGGPMGEFTPAISFVVTCTTHEEIDHFRKRLFEGGAPGQCGGLEEEFGVSWQVVSAVPGELLAIAPDRVMEVLLTMQSIDLGRLREAAASE